MFYYVSGTVAHIEPYLAVIDCGGVGYACRTTSYTLSQIKKGDKAKLLTYLNVREDAMELYGFASREEKQMFQSLTSISGVGSKMALSILGSMPLKELNLAILLGDITALSRAPGVGKKTAQRIALELKDKVSQADVSGVPEMPAAGGAVSVSADNRTEALEALQALGYTPAEARSAIAQVKDPGASVDEIIRLALRGMAGL